MNTFKEANAALQQYALPRDTVGIYSLDRMTKFMDALGNPQNKLKIIHVAGTSGKTSTCYFISSLLKSSGLKVGLMVSPHVYNINERVQINAQPLPEKQFCNQLEKFIKLVDKTNIKPSYFELLAAFAFWYFYTVKVDYAVIEVGVGGLLDGTNVINRSDKVCVIADIGLDHTEILGKSLEEIAAQKAGIITKNNHVFVQNQPTKILNVIEQVAKSKNAVLRVVSKPKDLAMYTPGFPKFQQRNYQLAVTTANYVLERDDIAQLDVLEIEQAKSTYIPARMEKIKLADKTIVLDGAHNTPKVIELVKALKQQYSNKKFAVLLAVKETKDFADRLDFSPLIEISNYIIVTNFGLDKDSPIKSVNPAALATILRSKDAKAVETKDSPALAFKSLRARPEGLLLVTGSFYIMSEIGKALGK